MNLISSPFLAPRIVRRTLRRLELLAGGIPWRRFVLYEEVLRAALPARAAAARHRAGLPEAVERERRFALVSDSYRAARDDQGDLDGRARRIVVDSLPWWTPLLAPDDPAAVERALRQQDFPYRALTQTRELAVGGIMLDIGANTGRMAIPRAILGDVQQVYCAEPDPLNYACLVRNVRDNGLCGLVMPDRVAIGSENTTVRMMQGKSSGGHRVVSDDVKAWRRTIDVPSLTLDTWCERLGIDLQQVAFVKVDTQGFELRVLRGASRVLACPHIAWQIEIDTAMVRPQDDSTGDVLAMLQQHFTHFIDLHKQARGDRVCPMSALPASLAYLRKGKGRTDILAFTMQDPSPGTAA
jgi:FkbM family methyltransferase